MCVPLVLFLSTVMLHSVSAGGVYCAKTARARAAALGLPYPGVHGAPDLYRPAHYGMHAGTVPFGPHLHRNDGPGAAEVHPNVAYYRRNYPGAGPSDDRAPKPAHPWSSASAFQLNRDTYSPARREYAAEQVLGPPGGQPVSNLKSNFEQVKRVAPPPAWAEAPGQPGLMNWEPQGRTEPLPFVYKEHDLVFDESVPNRQAVTLPGPPLPRRRGHGIYQSGLAGYGFGREVPVLGSSHLAYQPQNPAMTRRGPEFPAWERIWFPAHRARPLHRNTDVKHWVEGNPFFRRVINPAPVGVSR